MKYVAISLLLFVTSCAPVMYDFKPNQYSYDTKPIDYNIVHYKFENHENLKRFGGIRDKWEETLKDIFMEIPVFNVKSKNLAIFEISIISHDWGPMGQGYQSNLKTRYRLIDLESNLPVFEKTIATRGSNSNFSGGHRTISSLNGSIVDSNYGLIKELEHYSKKNN